ncbi:efflux RND transporter periplasmic adaptor subunit [Candidatus Sumerlaeota bacterium]|nr:efflux RND transporter periplasmic adaptor subunit [Candidatus Sumerlaeota bacterium]
MKKALIASNVLLLLLVAVLAMRTSSREDSPPAKSAAADSAAPSEQIEFWTCSMHPQIHQDAPGSCPLCGMDLIPVVSEESGSGEIGPREIRLSPYARKLAEVETTPVRREFVTKEVRMAGKVDYDESRLASINAWVPGRIERLFVDYTGIQVRKGDHMVVLYSPEILTAEQELLQARRALKELERSTLPGVREGALENLEASREKLRLWGLTADQIASVEQKGRPGDRITIYAPIGGVVIRKNAVEGTYVATGTKIYDIADLSKIWVKLDAYESDLPWIRYGQAVDLQTEAWPGETIQGRISFLDPVLDERTRTVKVRVNVDNRKGRLKPGMLVRAIVRSQVAGAGKVIDPSLAGKWICPMHPEIVKDEAGACDICGMPIVRAETLGYETAGPGEAPLVIPASAPLITGKRAVVYVAAAKREGVFEGREIDLGLRAGEFYIVNGGLAEGESVVTKGNFKIDSAMQIQAKPSMMSPEGAAPSPSHHGEMPASASAPGGEPEETLEVPGAFRVQIGGVLTAYLGVQQSLSTDDLDGAREAAKKVLVALEATDMTLLEGDAHMAWMKQIKALTESAGAIAGAEDNIGQARERFLPLSEAAISVADTFGSPSAKPLVRMHCPMAFDNRGADWLQDSEEVRNPYFGAAMLECGEIVKTYKTPK